MTLLKHLIPNGAISCIKVVKKQKRAVNKWLNSNSPPLTILKKNLKWWETIYILVCIYFQNNTKNEEICEKEDKI